MGGTLVGPLIEFLHTNLFQPRVYADFVDFARQILSELELVFARVSLEKNHLQYVSNERVEPFKVWNVPNMYPLRAARKHVTYMNIGKN